MATARIVASQPAHPEELSERKEEIAELFAAGGLVVLEDFSSSEISTLVHARDALFPSRMSYLEGNSPRTRLDDGWYTSTEYPAEYPITLHNELSYSARYPLVLGFFCVTPARTGGATLVASGVAVLSKLSDALRKAFEPGVRYVQNLHGGRGFGRSWQDTFETTSREQVDEILRERGVDWHWNGSELRIEQIRPSTRMTAGQEVWFNQADQWHWSNLDPESAESLRMLVGNDEDLPLHATFPDGTAIPVPMLDEIRKAAASCAVEVPWRAGQIVLIDNLRWMHGRAPFEGDRKLLLTMSTSELPG